MSGLKNLLCGYSQLQICYYKDLANDSTYCMYICTLSSFTECNLGIIFESAWYLRWLKIKRECDSDCRFFDIILLFSFHIIFKFSGLSITELFPHFQPSLNRSCQIWRSLRLDFLPFLKKWQTYGKLFCIFIEKNTYK